MKLVQMMERRNGERQSVGTLASVVQLEQTASQPRARYSRDEERAILHEVDALLAECGKDLSDVLRVNSAAVRESEPTYTQYAAIVAGDIGSAARCAGKKVFRMTCKASYPVMGNLSNKLQTRLEKLVGKENYDSLAATKTSSIVNVAVYSAAAGVIMYRYTTNSPLAVFTAVGGFAYGIVEGLCRTTEPRTDGPTGKTEFIDVTEPIGSLPGKIISLPIEGALYVADAMRGLPAKVRKYAASVKERAHAKRVEERT